MALHGLASPGVAAVLLQRGRMWGWWSRAAISISRRNRSGPRAAACGTSIIHNEVGSSRASEDGDEHDPRDNGEENEDRPEPADPPPGPEQRSCGMRASTRRDARGAMARWCPSTSLPRRRPRVGHEKATTRSARRGTRSPLLLVCGRLGRSRPRCRAVSREGAAAREARPSERSMRGHTTRCSRAPHAVVGIRRFPVRLGSSQLHTSHDCLQPFAGSSELLSDPRRRGFAVCRAEPRLGGVQNGREVRGGSPGCCRVHASNVIDPNRARMGEHHLVHRRPGGTAAVRPRGHPPTFGKIDVAREA